MNMPKVHNLQGCGASAAYNYTQTHGNVNDGDVLDLGNGNVGILIQAWPVIYAGEIEHFHGLAPGISWADMNDGKYFASAGLAQQVVNGTAPEGAYATTNEEEDMTERTITEAPAPVDLADPDEEDAERRRMRSGATPGPRPTMTKPKFTDPGLEDMFNDIQDFQDPAENPLSAPADQGPGTAGLGKATQAQTRAAASGVRLPAQAAGHLADLQRAMDDYGVDMDADQRAMDDYGIDMDADADEENPLDLGVGVRPPPVTPQNLPAVISRALTVKGQQVPKFHKVSDLPGNSIHAIRRLGKMVFNALTSTPTAEIWTVADLQGSGPNTTQEVNAVAAAVIRNGTEVSGPGDIDFAGSMPGYRADIAEYTWKGVRFHIVRDFAGNYIYAWPEADSKKKGNIPTDDSDQARLPAPRRALPNPNRRKQGESVESPYAAVFAETLSGQLALSIGKWVSHRELERLAAGCRSSGDLFQKLAAVYPGLDHHDENTLAMWWGMRQPVMAGEARRDRPGRDTDLRQLTVWCLDQEADTGWESVQIGGNPEDPAQRINARIVVEKDYQPWPVTGEKAVDGGRVIKTCINDEDHGAKFYIVVGAKTAEEASAMLTSSNFMAESGEFDEAAQDVMNTLMRLYEDDHAAAMLGSRMSDPHSNEPHLVEPEDLDIVVKKRGRFRTGVDDEDGEEGGGKATSLRFNTVYTERLREWKAAVMSRFPGADVRPNPEGAAVTEAFVGTKSVGRFYWSDGTGFLGVARNARG